MPRFNRSAHAIARLTARIAVIAFLLLASTRLSPAAELQKETVQAWNRYVQWAQQKVARELSNPNVFLIQNTLPPKEKSEIWQSLNRGEIVTKRVPSVVPQGISFEVPSGEIHHWWGTILLRNVTLERLLLFLQDYDHHAGKFSDVERSRLISKNGDRYRFFFRLRRSKAFVTAYYNTEQECLYAYYGSTRASSQSEAVKIAEIEDPGNRFGAGKAARKRSGIPLAPGQLVALRAERRGCDYRIGIRQPEPQYSHRHQIHARHQRLHPLHAQRIYGIGFNQHPQQHEIAIRLKCVCTLRPAS